ncbi:putative ABC transport system ATP-binding protein [Clostridium tetanomorphum]|uniref:ABC transporter ATP-binding protein n=1 Tax=Clostridium tetanomorphum TaxID=1553 RepID=UPI0004515965|nr:ABC transporter ATP-binding protein [Clostridium tetanomorphum]KAJ52464.1 ABC transporter-like protein [Clostridium tetanomorphum DSM 665]MBP1866512.1 putative ABC transport system ATP-binding protein [Clostridium tetanomorphum]NRS83868.1 putative ABC transport system ATP-binding protein [Clostridium tetanomorphum]SQB93199.1 ABC transporter [Clostridium tetanomorphum]
MFKINNVLYKNILSIERLEIPQNKVICIIGESGSGKSTLLRLLNKLISYTSGEILYKNQPLDTVDSVELRRNIVMLSQSPTIFPGTIRDNLLIGLKFAEKPIVNDEKLRQILEMVHLNKGLDDNIYTLSGGEKQRLALGRVLLLDPEVFLLDEPSSALDEETELAIIDELVSYTKETNKTLIMVTHSKKVAQTYSEYIIEISHGKVISYKEV